MRRRDAYGRATSSIAAANASVSTIVPAVAASPAPWTIATTTASRHHADTSSTAAQASAVLPSAVAVRPRSATIRASTGNAVTLIAVPMKSTNGSSGTPGGASHGHSQRATPPPAANGTAIPATLTAIAVLVESDRFAASSALPTKNM